MQTSWSRGLFHDSALRIYVTVDFKTYTIGHDGTIIWQAFVDDNHYLKFSMLLHGRAGLNNDSVCLLYHLALSDVP